MRSPTRSRRLLLLALGVVVVVAALVVTVVLARPGGSRPAAPAAAPPSSGAAASSSADGEGTYLALGDSVPFGFRAKDVGSFGQATNFTGYPELLARDLHLHLVNASCPGETTASFSDTTAPAFGCENSPQSPRFGYRSVYPLHVRYPLPQSQLEYAVQTVEADHDVRLVTVQLGANDGFLCRQTTADRCASEAGAVVAAARRGVEDVLATLRDRAGYRGQIAVVTYYALNYSGDAAAATRALDDALIAAARAHGAVVADGFTAFQTAATAAGGSAVDAGLVIPGDVHPTAEGQRLLAAALRTAIGG